MISSFIINKKPAVIATCWLGVLWCPGPDLNRYELFARGILRAGFLRFVSFQSISKRWENGLNMAVDSLIRFDSFQSVPWTSVQTRERRWRNEVVKFSILDYGNRKLVCSHWNNLITLENYDQRRFIPLLPLEVISIYPKSQRNIQLKIRAGSIWRSGPIWSSGFFGTWAHRQRLLRLPRFAFFVLGWLV
jgi:hypothetical protein